MTFLCRLWRWLSEAYIRVTLLTYIATRERGKMVQDIANIADRVQERDFLLHVGHLDHCVCRLTAGSTVVVNIFSGEGKKYVSKLGDV